MNNGYRTPRIMAGLLVALGLAAAALSASAQDYDLVILNGRVMDPETMLDAELNVGVKGGRIAALTKDAINGKQTINAEGLIVAPGFIDTHFHALDGLAVRLAALDGVTTGMDLEVGASMVDKWYDAKKGAWPLNYGTCASQELSRMMVHDPEVKMDKPIDATTVFDKRAEAGKDGVPGWSVTISTLDQMNEISAILDKDLRDGALCVASTVGYAREGITTYELFEAQKAGARYGRPLAMHSRLHGNNKPPYEGTLGFAEVFTNAVVLRAPLLYMHNNDYGWWEIEEKLQLARAQGMNMWSEYYPYDSAATAISAVFLQPDTWEKLMGYKYEETIYDPEQDKMLPKDEFLKVAKEDPARTVIVFNPNRKRWMPYWTRMPHMTVAADSMWSGMSWDAEYTDYKGHPRTAGTHGRAFEIARDNGVPLMFTLAQMSYWPAKHLGDTGLKSMQERGRLQVGMVADITVFDADKVRSPATYKTGEQGLPTIGIAYVIVGGVQVVKNSEFRKNVWAGQPIRFPVEAKGRFEPAVVEKWVKDFAIGTMSIDSGGVSANVPAASK